MALPFTDEQRSLIRQRLQESAQRHALCDGVQKTSLEMLTSDAGISKSSFYKFYDSKEQLFLEIALQWEQQVLSTAMRALEESAGRSSKERAAALVYRVFECIHELGIARFLKEDLAAMSPLLSKEQAHMHCLSSAHGIFDALRRAEIRFTAPDAIVLSVIQMMYLSILHIGEIGEPFFPALHLLVQSACEKLVAS